MADLQVGSLSVSSNVNTEEQIRESLNVPVETQADPSLGAPADAPSEGVKGDPPVSEPEEMEQVRDEQGRFTTPKPRDNPQARISQAVARQREAEAKAAALESRLAALEARSQAPAGQTLPKTNGNTGGLVTQARTKPIEDEIGTKYQSYADFAEDLADWKFEQRMAGTPKPEQIAAQVRQQLEYDSILADFTDRTTAFKETHPDYDQHVASTDKILTDAGLGLLPVMADAIVRSAHSAEISYWLATHPSEYLQLVQDLKSLDISAAPMVRRLLEKEAVSAGVPRGAAPTAQVSHAKPPIKPLGASAVTTDDPPGDEASAAQHARYWNRKLKVPGSQAS